MKVVVSGIPIPYEICEYSKGFRTDQISLISDESSNRTKTLIQSADYFLHGGEEYIDEQLIASASNLKGVSVLATGASSFIDLKAASESGIKIANTPGANAAAVSEFAVGQLVSMRRGILDHLGKTFTNRPATDEVSGSTVGLLGLGAVGSNVARILRQGFGCEVLYSCPNQKHELEVELGLQKVSTERLFTECSSVIVCCALNKGTERLVGSSLLQRGVANVIGISDVRVFNISDVLNELETGDLSAVAIDASPELIASQLPDTVSYASTTGRRLFITPHIAARSPQSWERMVEMGAENLLQMIKADEASS